MALTKRAFYALFAIIIIEGYIVLSSELLAIRVTIPFIGSGTDMVSIIIAAVLLPLSFGYYFGGQFRPHINKAGRWISVQHKLTNNILWAAAFLLIGISYYPLELFLTFLINHGVTNRVMLASIYSGLFLIIPVFLLGQTIPLVSNYFSKEKLSEITGKILFFSTIGSFLGATFATLVLMATIGVHHTAALNFILLAGLFFFLGRHRHKGLWVIMFAITMLGVGFNSQMVMDKLGIVNNNQYNVIKIYKSATSDARVISLNGNSDSMYDPTTKRKFEYIMYIEDEFIYSRSSDATPMNVLVIGAGGFSIGADDDYNSYHYVDIDPDLQKIAEEHFLGKKLSSNQKFHPVAAESFIIQGNEKFDMIVIDAFQGGLTIPENLITQEFFGRLKKRLKDGGVVVSNFTLNPSFASAFDRNLDATFRSVFPLTRTQIIGRYDAWNTQKLRNILYIYHHNEDEFEHTIYTDDKNTSYYDTPKERNPK
jgi:spermidine synthase